MISHSRLLTFALFLPTANLTAAAEPPSNNLFGTREKDAPGLIAIIYDLKQTQAREASRVNPDNYPEVIHEFVRKGWDESVLNRYFRITRPLFSSQIFIPQINADAAPKAYGVEKFVKPSCWVIHYKGQVSPPEDGTYRFVGYADDFIAVAVDNKTACVGSHILMRSGFVWKSNEKTGAKAANGELTYGDWITLKKDQPVDLDVLVGERPGGEFSAFLLVQKQGHTYPNDASGHPILPVFRLTDVPISVKSGIGAPHFSVGKIWQLHR